MLEEGKRRAGNPVPDDNKQADAGTHVIIRHLAAILVIAGTAMATPVAAAVINVDYDADGSVQTGAVGIFSTSGTVWNGVRGNTALMDEFGAATPVSIGNYFSIGAYCCSGPELLSDSGFVDAGGGASHDISGLTLGQLYDIAFYGIVIDSDVAASAVRIAHAGGTATSGVFGYPDGSADLPGAENEEYVLFSGLAPMDLGGGMAGFTITVGATGRIFSGLSGFQIRDALTTTDDVPAPATLGLLGLGLAGLGAARRRRRA